MIDIELLIYKCITFREKWYKLSFFRSSNLNPGNKFVWATIHYSGFISDLCLNMAQVIRKHQSSEISSIAQQVTFLQIDWK